MNYLTRKRDMFIASAEDWGLPKGYTKVNYIETTTRKEWFDIGVYSSSDLRMVGKVYATTPEDDEKFVYGAEGTFGTESTALKITSNGSWTVRCNSTNYTGLAPGVNEITYDIDRNRAILNGVTVATYSCKDYETTARTMYISGTSSGLRTRTNKGDNGLMRFEFHKVYRGIELIKDIIPCLDVSGTPCFFDRAEQITHYNQGDGTVTYG